MLIRFNIRGAMPNTQANMAKLNAVKPIKDVCVIINEGELNAEYITNFTYHICKHDEGLPCGEEQEI